MNQVWVLDDDKSIRWVFEKALAKANITFECFSNTNEAINKFNHEQLFYLLIPHIIFDDIFLSFNIIIIPIQRTNRF